MKAQMCICAIVGSSIIFTFNRIQWGLIMRLSIDITTEQHQKIKAVSALSGQSIKGYVLERLFPNNTDLQELEGFLEPRILAAERGAVSDKSVKQIFEETYQEMK